jgi:transcription antitermination protein NusB
VSGPGGRHTVGGRRTARERALGLLYEADAKGIDVGVVVGEQAAPPDPFAVAVAVGVAAHRVDLDELIGRFSRGWRIERMPAVDRTVLRMATFELAHRPDVPTGTVISEAVELAKRFSTEDSGRFVNGLLARLATELRPDGPAGGGIEPAVELGADRPRPAGGPHLADLPNLADLPDLPVDLDDLDDLDVTPGDGPGTGGPAPAG